MKSDSNSDNVTDSSAAGSPSARPGVAEKAARIDFFTFSTPQMRAFHMSWAAFFLCFFAWFGAAPLMAVIRDELALSEAQVGNIVIASVAVTVIARPLIGRLCDWIGPRKAYSGLLILGSLPVMGIGFAQSYETFLLFRLAIGGIGASFVITQYHTSRMFAPNVVGSANAITAGWGNMGGGATQVVMPLLFSGFLVMGLGDFWSWRLSMFAAGVICLCTGIAYYFLTQDTPAGNFDELREQGYPVVDSGESAEGSFWMACKDYRVWLLAIIYGACFGIELTMNNILSLYFTDYFDMGIKMAGLIAGSFGLLNLFARPLGGFMGDKSAVVFGLRGRVLWLFTALMCEGIALIIFSRADTITAAIVTLLPMSILVMMAEGATFSVVPFVNRKALGTVAGIVGAGGNLGAVTAGFLFKGAFEWPTALLILGGCVCLVSLLALAVQFTDEQEAAATEEIKRSVKRAQQDAVTA